MDANFDDALMAILRHEGVYSNDPHDPGGETHYGISLKWNPDVDPEGLNARAVREKYRRDYWNAINADLLPPGMDVFAFDMAVNLGPTKTREILREAMTLEDLQKARSDHYSGLVRDNPKMMRYYGGWLKRSEQMMQMARDYEASNMPRFTQHMQVKGTIPLGDRTLPGGAVSKDIEDRRGQPPYDDDMEGWGLKRLDNPEGPGFDWDAAGQMQPGHSPFSSLRPSRGRWQR